MPISGASPSARNATSWTQEATMADNEQTSTVTIETPVEGYEGTVAGVTFSDGKAETDDPRAIAYFRRHGYTVDGETPERPEAPAAPTQRGPVRVGTALADAADTPDDESAGEPAPDGRTEAIDALVDSHDRPGLDEQAEDLGLDPSDYRTKADVAAAIVDARESAR